MKTSFIVIFSCLSCLAHSQNQPNGDTAGLRGWSGSLSSDSDKNRQFLSACPQQCDCSETACGLSVDCSFRMLTAVPEDVSPLTECLDLSMNNISTITTTSFEGLRQLKRLSLSGNVITELPQNAFAASKKLEELLMQDNKLREIAANTVSKLPNLKDLNVGANYISSISSNAFVRLDSLEHLWLDDNNLTEIPTRALSRAPTIKALALDMNRITAVRNGDLDALRMLRVLLLKHNLIERIENNVFENSRDIRIIDLSFNNLTFLPPALKDALTVDELKLSYNKIKFLPDLAFAGNPELEILTLTGNPIRSAGKTSFTGLRNLKNLSLENAKDLSEFPDLSGCEKLKSLVLTGGKLKSLPRNLCVTLPDLQELILSGNRIRNMSGLSLCNNLTHLDVSDNELTEVLFADTRNMSRMLDLNLGNNEIQHLDKDAFSKMNRINKLNLAHNSFTYLPMRGLGGLRDLNISGVRTMLYLPPIALFHNLKSLAAYYPYHCCQVAKIPRKADYNSLYQQFPQDTFGTEEDYDFLPMTSPVQCSPGPGPMTPCDDLLPSTLIRVFWWFAMVASFFLNGVILLACGLRYCSRRRSARPSSAPSDEEILRRADSESTYRDARVALHDSSVAGSRYFLHFNRGSRGTGRESDTFDMTLCHLALADFVVSSYTAVVLSYDRSTRGDFAENGAWWQQSALCHSAGFLLTFGTQLAFCTVFVMAIERYLATMYPLRTELHMGKKVLIMTLSAFWVFSLGTAIVTLIGRAGDDRARNLLDQLPAKRGATCLPWTTEFPYVGALVGIHVLACCIVLVACTRMFCARRKQSWLSAQKSTRRQATTAASVNILLISPLALLAVSVSGYMTYSDWVVGHGGEFSAPEDGRTVLDMEKLLTFVLFFLPIRPLLNAILYIAFNRPLRRDLVYLGKKVLLGEPSPRNTPFHQRHNSVMETAFDSVGYASQEASGNPFFDQPAFDNEFMRQTVAYDNRGIASSSSVSYHAASLSLAQSSGQAPSSQRTTSTERRKRRRHTRSQRGERRTTDTDLTTESEIITFHRSGEVSYKHQDAKERRKKKLSVRCGGVNAKDEFQRLVFPRISNASSSERGSSSTVYPIMPASMSAVTGSSCAKRNYKGSSKNLSCDADASDVSSADCASSRGPKPTRHYDLSALNAFYAHTESELTSSTDQRENPAASKETSCHREDIEADDVSSEISPVSKDENPFFSDRDTAKRLYSDVTPKILCHARSQEDDCQSSATREPNNNSQHVIGSFDADPAPMRNEAFSPHSPSAGGEARPIGRMGKMGNSCEYCDSAASKDSGIHSEIDSTSGASYSDTSIGRRLHFSTSGFGLKNIEVSTLGQRDVASRYYPTTFLHDFEIVPGLNDANEVKINPVLSSEITL